MGVKYFAEVGKFGESRQDHVLDIKGSLRVSSSGESFHGEV